MSDPQLNGRPFIGQHPRSEKGGSWDEPRQEHRDMDKEYYSDGQCTRESDPRSQEPDHRDPRTDKYSDQPDPRGDRRYSRESDDSRGERRHREEQDPPRSERRHRESDPGRESGSRSDRRHREADQDPRSDRHLREGSGDQDPRRQRRSPQPPRRSPQQPRHSPQGPRKNTRQGGQRQEGSRRRSGQGSNNEAATTDTSSGSGNSTESQQHQLEADCKVFMHDLIYRIFNQSSTISQEDNSAFGTFCRHSVGRQWFARLVDAERVNSQKVSEQTFYRLVQFFAVCLFECNEADDFSPAKNLMNMCFTFYHDHEGFPVSNEKVTKSFLYTHLTEQPIWKSLRFWNASFFDAVHCERKQRSPVDRGNWRHQSTEERASTEIQDENITFGQLATFLHNMMELGLSRETVRAFLDKQAVIGNLSPDQTELLHGNVEQYYRERQLHEIHLKRQQQQQRNQIQRPRSLQKNQQVQHQQQQQHNENPMMKFGQFLKFQLNSLSSTR